MTTGDRPGGRHIGRSGGADPAEATSDTPLYVRVLRLRRLHLGGLHCFLLCEVMVGIAALLALAELVPWWGVLALPLAVAAMVKVNDMIMAAGATATVPSRSRRPAGRDLRLRVAHTPVAQARVAHTPVAQAPVARARVAHGRAPLHGPSTGYRRA